MTSMFFWAPRSVAASAVIGRREGCSTASDRRGTDLGLPPSGGRAACPR